MEPLSALALSGNVLQFIESASKLIREARQVCHSANGITAGNRDAIAVYDDFQVASAGLAARTADDFAVVSLAERCQELSDDLVQGLRSLQAINPGSKRDSLRVAWRTLRDKGELESLEKRLDRYRQQLVTRIIFLISQEQSSTYRLLQEYKWQSEESGTRTRDDLQRLSQELLSLSRTVEEHSSQAAISGSALHDVQDATVKMVDLISGIIATRTRAEKEIRILDRLKFPEMRQWENAVGPARAGTYRWLLYPPSGHPPTEEPDPDQHSSVGPPDKDEFVKALRELNKWALRSAQSFHRQGEMSELHARTRASFLNWLESGSGIFYISGKPGSGKSTMMKFLARETRAIRTLESWAAGKQLALASFFFWSSGLAIQRSMEGLYRGLLWETLRVCPELTPALFPRMWDSGSGRGPPAPLSEAEFSLSELEEAFARLTSESSILANYRIVFFIDGLDEFDGDHGALAKLLKEWTTSSAVKMCVSSRPYNEFETSFITQPKQCLRLHEHTYQDMIQAAQDQLKDTERHAALYSDTDYALLIKSVVEKANGVFLWLRLAMRHLVRGIGSAYSVHQLAEMLHAMPDDVSVMFQRMLDKLLARPDRVRVAITLLCLSALSKKDGQYVMYFSIMDDVLDGSIAVDDLVRDSLGKRYSPGQIEKCLVSTEERLKGRCEDFIDIHDSSNCDIPPLLRRYIGFIHRDLRDFLFQDHIVQKLHKVAGWSPAKLAGLHRYLGLVLLKTVPSIGRRRSIVDDLVDDFYYSDSVSAPELELLVTLIVMHNGAIAAVEGILQRYCFILALRDNIPNQQVVEKIYYGRNKRQHPLSVVLGFVSAAAFHRHDEYVLGVITRCPLLLGLDSNTNLLLSASLGGAAALAAFAHQDKQAGELTGIGTTQQFMKSIARLDHAVNRGGVGGLLYPKTPTEVFPGSAAAHQALDTVDVAEPQREPRPLRRGGADPLMLARSLLQKGASPNTRLVHFEVPAWQGSCWTPWTATLLSLAGVIRKGELLDSALLDLVELYVSHGADPTICFVGRYIPKHKLKPVPTWRIGPGIYATVKLDSHVPTLFDEEHGGWHYLTLSQLVELVESSHPRRKTVLDLLYSKSPWAVSRWMSQAATGLGGWRSAGAGAGAGGPPNISKLELAQLGTCYFFVSMIVREDELKSVVIPDEARSRLLPAHLIPI